MKKKVFKFNTIMSIFFCFFLLFVTSCAKKHPEVITGVKPTAMFTFHNYYDSDMVINAQSNIVITGVAEKGVSMFLRLYDEDLKVVAQDNVIVDNSGTFELSFLSPKPSFEQYSLEISDSYLLYKQKFTNILFGKSILILGEDFINETIKKEYNKTELANISYYDGSWHKLNQNAEISKLGYLLAKEYLNENIPVGIVNKTSKTMHLGALINPDLFTNPKIKEYNEYVLQLLLESDYYQSYQKFDNSSVYNSFVKNLNNISFSSLILFIGNSDLYSNIGFNSANTRFSYNLSMMIKDYLNKMDVDKTIVIQSKSYEDINNESFSFEMSFLREAQASASYYNNAIILPTYCYTNDLNIEDVAFDIYDVLVTNKKYPSYAKLIIEDNNIEIEFSNTIKLKNVDKINNFYVYDSNNDDITNKLDIRIIDNKIIIKTLYTEIINGNEATIKYNISSIVYNFSLDNHNGNLRNQDDRFVVPFKIIL